jgi:hypothetical protein
MSIALFVAGCIFILGGVGLWLGLLVCRIQKKILEKKITILLIIAGVLNVIGGILNIILAFSR